MLRTLARWGGGAAVVALVVSSVGPAASSAWATAPNAGPEVVRTPQRPGEPARSVTLITGDRVTVRADGVASFEPGAGRDGIPAVTRRLDGRLRVTPVDALPLVEQGRLDARLFDVTTLIEFGYDDRRGDLPLIVTTAGNRSAARGTVTARGAKVVRDLPSVGGMAVRAAKSTLTDFWQGIAGGATAKGLRGGVSKVWLDGLRKPTLERSVPQIGAPAAWQAGLDGAGVTVAVLDTGVDADHPDLAGQVTGTANFTDEDARDVVGHGTHVASTIAGTGAASDGRNKGVAPGARLLSGKVCGARGCPDSSILAGMQWAAERGAAVVNLSLGSGDTPEVDPIEQAVQTLTEQHGTLFVVAAGNSGRAGTIGSPASADSALAVGAVDRSDELADFSSRGPRAGDSGPKPDITAPGVEIVAASSSDGPLPEEPYLTASGTSMATPHVAGAAAILAQQHPGWKAAALKSTLMAAAVPHPDLDMFAQGAGRVDVARAIGQTLATDPPSVGFGRREWPHHDDVPVSKPVTYRNSGTAPVTLAVSVQASGPDGTAAPAGLFTVSASTVTVPAGGTAEVTVTADTRVGVAEGAYTGRVVAISGDLVLRTPITVDREAEVYDLTISYVNRAGAAIENCSELVRLGGSGLTSDDVIRPVCGTVRLPAGRYALFTRIKEESGEGVSSLLTQPVVEVNRPTTVTVDARKAKPVSVTVPRADATQVFADLAVNLQVGVSSYGYGVLGDDFAGMHLGRVDDGGPVEGFSAGVTGTWARVDPEIGVHNSPFVYNLAWSVPADQLDGFTRQTRDRDLATVHARYARNVPGSFEVNNPAIFPGNSGAFVIPLTFDSPFEGTEYFNADPDVRWARLLFEQDASGRLSTVLGFIPLTYRAGTVTRDQWNQAVFGASLEAPVYPEDYVSRVGDEIFVNIPLFADGAGRQVSSFDAVEKMVLYRDGVKVGESDGLWKTFEVPAAAADYRLEVTGTRGHPVALSTRVEAAWTFRSGHVAGENLVRLPLSGIRFSPALDQLNTAPAGQSFLIPVSVRPQPGTTGGGVRSVGVDVSYDDGATWQKATVVAVNGVGTVHVKHPKKSGFVSLRATATDRSGNTVRQTVIRAYEIR
ncbi:S8 family serine peptidase [Plantactinospora sp. S1510]|uniref:S8 family serine peptidase n=1 Tax=Plantactinospora alkalitolerans TaxID=2789879 RepID=A0ABS0GTK7_9ACTN|nr:S8 family serine peptidase [Plantactinospora alkalitolerans]MBF9129523.1 S8 family serine peptidase [Plantactinospora alkalitolerans]